MSTDLKLSKARISKIFQSEGFWRSLLSKLAGPLKKVAIPLAKNVLARLGITTTASAINAGIQKKIPGSGSTILIISDKEMNDIMKIVQALEDSNIVLKGVTKIKMKKKKKEQKGGSLSILLGTLGASLLGNLLAGKGIIRAGSGNKKGKGIVQAGTGKDWDFWIPSHPLTNFEIQKYYQNEPRFNGIYWKNNLPKKIKNRAYVINIDEHADVGMHWIALFCNKNEWNCLFQ